MNPKTISRTTSNTARAVDTMKVIFAPLRGDQKETRLVVVSLQVKKSEFFTMETSYRFLLSQLDVDALVVFSLK